MVSVAVDDLTRWVEECGSQAEWSFCFFLRRNFVSHVQQHLLALGGPGKSLRPLPCAYSTLLSG